MGVLTTVLYSDVTENSRNRDDTGKVVRYKVRYVAKGYAQLPSIEFNKKLHPSPTLGSSVQSSTWELPLTGVSKNSILSRPYCVTEKAMGRVITPSVSAPPLMIEWTVPGVGPSIPSNMSSMSVPPLPKVAKTFLGILHPTCSFLPMWEALS
jgi:hypothetical protein